MDAKKQGHHLSVNLPLLHPLPEHLWIISHCHRHLKYQDIVALCGSWGNQAQKLWFPQGHKSFLVEQLGFPLSGRKHLLRKFPISNISWTSATKMAWIVFSCWKEKPWNREIEFELVLVWNWIVSFVSERSQLGLQLVLRMPLYRQLSHKSIIMNGWLELNLLAKGTMGAYFCLHKRNNLKCEL